MCGQKCRSFPRFCLISVGGQGAEGLEESSFAVAYHIDHSDEESKGWCDHRLHHEKVLRGRRAAQL